jgi:DNA-binding GntR family transcriptional regulator
MEWKFLKKGIHNLKNLFLDGTYPPGTLFSERKLGEQLGMSKTPIQAALERLEAEGFIATAPQQGIIVRELSLREIREHYSVHIALGTYIVRQIAGRLTPKQIIALEVNLERQRKSIQAGDTNGYVDADAAFHLILADILSNEEIKKVMQHQRDRLFLVAVQISRQVPARMGSSLEEHIGIFEAIQSGDEDLAAQKIQEHLESGKQYLLTSG